MSVFLSKRTNKRKHAPSTGVMWIAFCGRTHDGIILRTCLYDERACVFYLFEADLRGNEQVSTGRIGKSLSNEDARRHSRTVHGCFECVRS